MIKNVGRNVIKAPRAKIKQFDEEETSSAKNCLAASTVKHNTSEVIDGMSPV